MEKTEIQKILVISLTNLGDVVMTTPVFSVLKENFPKAVLTVVTGPKAEMLLAGSRTVDRVIVYDKRRMPLPDKCRLIASLRKQRFDLAIDLRNTVIPYLIGARLQSHFIFGRQPVPRRERHLNRLRFLHLPSTPAHFDFFSSEDTEYYKNILRENHFSCDDRFIVIAPGAGSHQKRWQIKGFQEIASYFALHGETIMIAGSPDERELGEAICRHVPGIFNACGRLTLRQAAALIHDAKLIVSNDSAVMHLGNEQGVPVAAIFGPTDERRYAKFGPRNRNLRREQTHGRCQESRCLKNDQICLHDVPVENVIRACEELLNETTG